MSLDDQLSAIAQLWSAGLPLSEIAHELGEATRSAVAGKIQRARRKGDPRFQPRSPKPKLRVRGAKVPSDLGEAVRPAPPRPIIAAAPAIASAPVERAARLLIDLDWTDCRWPVGEAPDGRHLFCGRPQAPGRPYCARCCARLKPSPASPSSPFRAPVLRRGGA
jgi:GcrA cell cycle regulator